MTGIWAPIDVEKNVFQRLADQDSSRRWGLICPSQLIGLKKRIRVGTSSSWDSSPPISVLRTDSSTVAATTRCCERKLNCSAWRDPTYLSLRSRKGWQWSRICLVTLNWEGMTVTSRACPLPRLHLLQHVNAKRDSIYSKTRQWKYYWL